MSVKPPGLREKNWLMRQLIPALLAVYSLLAISFMPWAHAANNPLGSNSFGATQQDEFLPVDQAYQQDFLFAQNGEISALFQIAPEYYLYRDKLALYLLGEDGKTELPLEIEKGEVIWDDYFEKETEVYRWQLEIPVSIPSNLRSADTPLKLELHYQGCADAGLCYPPQTRRFAIDLNQQTATPLSAGGPSAATGNRTPLANYAQSQAAADSSDTGFLLALLLAFGGGLILNLMPCVFPVLSIKALAITHSKGNHHLHGWAYTAGVIATFTLIAAVMLALRATGEAVGWGFQLQSPPVVATLVYLFFIMGLSLSGLTEFGSRLMGMGGQTNSGLSGSFSTGALASVVASPCTAPMMGSALGFAVTQPAPVALAVFAALGAGMAAPFLLLTYAPQLAERLPRPGPWMERLKQLLAFPMYLTAVWLLWVLGRQTGSDGVALVLAGAVAIAFALWLWPRPTDITQGVGRFSRSALAVAALAGAALLIPQLEKTAGSSASTMASSYWQTYSPETLESARAEGQPVLINMTAAWCITCLANEKVVLSSDAVSDAIGQLGITALKGDWTNQDPQISDLLARYGRTSVPLYLLYPAGGGEPTILPQILTRDGLLSALRDAAGKPTVVSE
ncbi:protein-disulfide reductase DsbD family protein [Microbulbifer aggregans]|uniref:protein-disulfide reductase DsbD family protein n=1 Tax=Microbulbifer aggregans TaxID=1769779 RepID=UPI001CFDA177|nr:protein-disulfide reductase DsbD [Microbulbifer aggregans]